MSLRDRLRRETDAVPPQREANYFASAVAITIALTTLIAAVTGYLQANVSNRASDLRLEAEALSLEAAASVQRSQQSAQVQYELYARSIEQRTRAANAMLRYLYASADPAEARRLELEQERWAQLAESTAAASGIGDESEFGPQRDPIFPARFFAAATYDSLRLNALQDAGNEVATALDEQAAAFTAVLAMLAISLYLFGLTLAVDERPLRAGFLTVGLALAAAAATWMLVTAGVPQPEISAEAAEEYARGRVALDTAYDAAGFRDAEAHYDRAIELRPTFGRAYFERAAAIMLASTPQRASYVSIVTPEALERSRADRERAIELGLESGPLYTSLGFGAFIEGIRGDDRALIEQSIAYLRRAIELDPSEAVHHYNLGVALLAAGRFEESRRAYFDAVGWTLFSDAGRSRPRGAPAFEQQQLAGALTDLEILLRYQPGSADQVRTIKSEIVGRVSVGSMTVPDASPAILGDVELTIHPAQIGWQARVENYDPGRDFVSTQWYHRDPASGDWAALPTVGGALPLGTLEDGRRYVNAYYITSVYPPACLSVGSYRLEIYLNGRLWHAPGALAAEAEFGQLEAYVGRDVTVGFCRPADWEPLGDEALPGLLNGYRSPDGQYGAYVLRVGMPRSWQALPSLTTTFMDLAIEQFAELLPAQATYYEAAGTDTYHFLGLQRSAWRWYDTGVGWVRAGGGLTEDGSVIVGMVFGPREWFDDGRWFEVVGSMVLIE